MKTALIAVDVQYDFLPGGALAAPDGDKIIHPLTLAARDCDLVIATRDWHPANHSSFREFNGDWPPHCIQDTRGAKIHPKIAKLANYVISKGMDQATDAYSGFAGRTLRPIRTLEEILRRHDIDQVIVGGLVLEYCVRFTALDANALGFATVVPLNCTAALGATPPSVQVRELTHAGVRVVETL